MAKKMLIDATHEEETRVAIVEDNRLEEYDYESAFRKALKGNIYLAKVTRVEPSLQAAFVNFGGNRHGFLPFSEIHPDYFRIPVSDREALMAAQEEDLKEHDEAEAKAEDGPEITEDEIIDEIIEEVVTIEPDEKPKRKSRAKKKKDEEIVEETTPEATEDSDDEDEVNGNVLPPEPDEAEDVDGNTENAGNTNDKGNNRGRNNNRGRGRGRGGRGRNAQNRNREAEIIDKDEQSSEQSDEQRFRYNLRRKYKIQEVIKRGQIMLVQVSKEERGNKGAAVGSYLSLPGRYCVLMPNSPRSGGVSRKIANFKDRAKMRDMLKEIEVPKGMSVIMRTAGVTRTKTEIKRDLDYLLRLWNKIRELTMESTAPALVYEEADLIKRAVRDLYTRDVEEIIVSGDKGHKNAKEFMKMMIPSHAKRISEYTDQAPLFARYKVEDQINEMSLPTATMKSGGYLVINPTEALVSIDVNSGKATKERHIEGTALKTNLEAADEVARQLRLRDLGGLVVIDFIDMESRGNNAKVERRLKEALSGDRARIQVGRISSFGLLELSRQRMNPSLNEAQYETCPNCDGLGTVRTADATSVLVTRAIEEEGLKGRASQLIVHVPTKVALYLLNGKRAHLSELEKRYDIVITIRVEDTLAASDFRVEVSKPSEKGEQEQESKGRNNRGDNRGGNKNDNRNNNSKNESKSDDEDGEKSENSRRRGRRGGRRRNRNRDENQDNANAESGAQKSADDPKTEQKDETPEQEQKKPRRRSATKKDEPKADETKSEDIKSEDKPKKRPSRAKKSTEDSKTDEAPAKEKKAPAKKKAAAKKTPEPSNDEKAAEPNHASNFETVNEAPKKKKKGWWSKD